MAISHLNDTPVNKDEGMTQTFILIDNTANEEVIEALVDKIKKQV